jgi:hypothetical protein
VRFTFGAGEEAARRGTAEKNTGKKPSATKTPAMTDYEGNLPHWHPDGASIFLTWRLFGALPRNALGRIKNLHTDPRRQFLAAEALLDRPRSGPRWLADPKIAGLIEKTLERGEELRQYLLRAWGDAQSRPRASGACHFAKHHHQGHQRSDCKRGKHRPRSCRESLLARRVIRPMDPQFSAVRARPLVHRTKSREGRPNETPRRLALVKRSQARDSLQVAQALLPVRLSTPQVIPLARPSKLLPQLPALNLFANIMNP